MESAADSDLEDGESQKMLTSPLCAQKTWENPIVVKERQIRTQGNQIRKSVFRNANPSNLRGSLSGGDKDHGRDEDHLLSQAKSDLGESVNKCIHELNDRRKSKD